MTSDVDGIINPLVMQYRGERFTTKNAPCSTAEEAQSLLASLSAGDTLASFSRDVASATKTTPIAVGMTVLTGQPLVLSAGNIGTVAYSVAMHRSGTVTIQFPTIKGSLGISGNSSLKAGAHRFVRNGSTSLGSVSERRKPKSTTGYYVALCIRKSRHIDGAMETHQKDFGHRRFGPGMSNVSS